MIHVLSGDIYKINQHKQALLKEFKVKHGELAVVEINVNEATETETVIQALTATSLFNPQKLVILKNLDENQILKAQLETILTSVIEEVELVIIQPQLTGIDSFSKILKKQSGYMHFKPDESRDLVIWVEQRVKAKGGSINSEAAAYLINRVGAVALSLDSEIAKLAVWGKIDKALVDKLTTPSPDSVIFSLIEALFRGQLTLALTIYQDQRQQKNEPLSILATIIWQLQILTIVQNFKKTPNQQLTVDFGIHDFTVTRAKNLLNKLNFKQLQSILELAYQTDKRIKHQFINPDESLMFLILKTCLICKTI